jgi:hypothetical protein
MRRIFYRARSVRDFSALRSRISRLSVSYAISTPTDRSAALNLRQFVKRQAGANLRPQRTDRSDDRVRPVLRLCRLNLFM